MANMNVSKSLDIDQWDQAILRAKTTLIKPYSKYTEEGLRARTPNEPYTILTDEQIRSIDRSASPLFFDQSKLQAAAASSSSTTTGRRFRQRCTDAVPMSHLRVGGSVGSGTHFTFVGAEPYSSILPAKYPGSSDQSFPKWYPNQAGERTSAQMKDTTPVERYVSIDMFRRAPTARSGQIIFDHGRANDGYYLPRNGYETTWFGSNIKLNRRSILDSIQPKTIAEYEQQRAKQQEKYRQANDKWPFLSEYSEQFVIGKAAERRQPTDLERAKQHIGHNTTTPSAYHNQLAASAVSQGRTLLNDPSLSVKC